MTDYLQELLNGADVLLEQLRRLDASVLRPAPEEYQDVLSAPAQERKPFPAHSPAAQETASRLSEASPIRPPDSPDSAESAPPVAKQNYAKQSQEQLQSTEDVPLASLFPSQEKEKNLPLLEQLERLEYSAAVLDEGALLRQSAPQSAAASTEPMSYPMALSKVQGGQTVPELETPSGWHWRLAPDNAQTAAGGDLSLAEQTDQAFRRDSRRYDGGFYLY